MKSRGIRLYAAHLKGKNNYYDEDLSRPCAFLIGNEANGLSDETAAMADVYVKIPMSGQVESLNAAMAAGILMYEMRRQTSDAIQSGKVMKFSHCFVKNIMVYSKEAFDRHISLAGIMQNIKIGGVV